MITVSQCAVMFGVNVSYIRRLCAQGKILGAAKVGAQWVIPLPVRFSGKALDMR